MTTKAIFFDAVGTLIHLPRPVGEHYREIARRHGVDWPAEAFEAAFRRAFAAAPARPATDGPRPDDDKGWWRDLVARVVAGVQPAGERAAFDEPAFFEELYAHFAAPGVWAAYPEVHGVLQDLRAAGPRLGVISNFDRRLHAVLDALELTSFFDAVIISSEVGVEKPAARIFQRALDALDMPAAEAVHIGDEEADWAAQALGLRVVRLARPGMTLRDVAAHL